MFEISISLFIVLSFIDNFARPSFGAILNIIFGFGALAGYGMCRMLVIAGYAFGLLILF